MDEIRIDDNGLMLRPRRRDDCVRRRAAEMALPQFKRWMGAGSGYSDADLIKLLMKHIDGWDGYTIAKSLERDCGDADPGLVEIMDSDFISEALNELTRQWVRCLGIKLDLPIGTLVDHRGEKGTIADLRPDLAQYGIQLPSNIEGMLRIVIAEDVKPIQAILEESAA